MTIFQNAFLGGGEGVGCYNKILHSFQEVIFSKAHLNLFIQRFEPQFKKKIINLIHNLIDSNKASVLQ